MRFSLKHLVALLTLTLCLALAPAASAAFTDVPADHWASAHITAMQERGIVEGSGGRFRPGDSVSNQAFLAMVCRASGMDDRTLEQNWTVRPLLAYGRYFGWFQEQELPEDRCGDPITREFAAKLLVKAFFPNEKLAGGEKSFSDSRKMDVAYRDYVNTAVRLGLISGYEDGTFRPKDPLTRAAAAALLDRTLTRTETLPASPTVQVPVLMYHDVSDLGYGYSKTPEQFRAQMQELKDAGFHTVSYTQLIDFVEQGTPLPEKPIVITLDDGYRSNYEYVFPILQELDMKAEIALIGGAIQYTSWGLKWDEVRQMQESGLVSFQAHTYQMHEDATATGGRLGVLRASGEPWSTYTAALGADTTRILNAIEKQTGVRPVAFTYPRGKWNHLAEGLVTRLGCKVTVTTIDGVAAVTQGDPASLHLMDRIGMDFRNGSVVAVLKQFGYQM